MCTIATLLLPAILWKITLYSLPVCIMRSPANILVYDMTHETLGEEDSYASAYGGTTIIIESHLALYIGQKCQGSLSN